MNSQLGTLQIKSLGNLANHLKIHEKELFTVSENMEEFVKPRFEEKPDGKVRKIYKTANRLKRILKSINKNLLQRIILPESLHGGVPGRSALSNASLHSGKPVVAKLDIKSFFPSIHYKQVYELFNNDLKCSPDIARLLTRLTTYDFHLAQGFVTSPMIANLMLKKFEPRIRQLAELHGLTFSLYQDDLTISGGYRAKKLRELFKTIIHQSGYTAHKLSVATQDERQLVTGYVVNQKPNVSRAYYDKVKATLHNCRTKGIESQADKPMENFLGSLQGKIIYIAQANPRRGSRLWKMYEELVSEKSEQKS